MIIFKHFQSQNFMHNFQRSSLAEFYDFTFDKVSNVDPV
jgi:hypothetical protein